MGAFYKYENDFRS